MTNGSSLWVLRFKYFFLPENERELRLVASVEMVAGVDGLKPFLAKSLLGKEILSFFFFFDLKETNSVCHTQPNTISPTMGFGRGFGESGWPVGPTGRAHSLVAYASGS